MCILLLKIYQMSKFFGKIFLFLSPFNSKNTQSFLSANKSCLNSALSGCYDRLDVINVATAYLSNTHFSRIYFPVYSIQYIVLNFKPQVRVYTRYKIPKHFALSQFNPLFEKQKSIRRFDFSISQYVNIYRYN